MQSFATTTTSSSPLFGVSQPISTALPTPNELFQTDAMLQELKDQRTFETKEETMKRVHILQKLTKTARKWEAFESRHIKDYAPSAQLLAFGSYRLNVHSPGGDIDTLLVVPRHISRKQFFSTFVELLKMDKFITELNAVPEAYVPIVTFKFAGVEVDVLFANLDMKQIPIKLDLSDDRILKNLDQKSIRSLNGCRVAEQLLNSVPNQKEFCLALRAVKLWAKNHGLNSNAMGFLGGVSWAILVARACQLYPNATAAKIVQKMFMVFGSWNWKAPVILYHLPDTQDVWNPRVKYADRLAQMPIITPAWPQQNSTFNVSKSSAEVISKEMKEAEEICKSIDAGKSTWKDLFEPVNFFSRNKHFLAVTVNSKSKSEQTAYLGFLESKLRHMVTGLERNCAVDIAHLDTNSYVARDGGEGEETEKLNLVYFIGLKFVDNVKNLDLTRETEQFKKSLDSQAEAAGVPKTEIDIVYVKQSKLINIVNSADLKKGRFWKPSTASSETKKRKAQDIDSNGSAQPAKVLKAKN